MAKSGRARVVEKLTVPGHLSAEAGEIWRVTVPILEQAGRYGPDVAALLEIYCVQLARMRQAEAHLAEFGAVVENPRTGLPQENPYLAIANRAAASIQKAAVELGLTRRGEGRRASAETASTFSRDDVAGELAGLDLSALAAN